eukprot:CAMPEP_0198253658 /NCGR_PEP_ID=MMETSP1447-20131203/4063_1 /TAXON_ID=420782 /ORGANISM="Chaetoceros dichaeta, Strain CCMP1751" /LENGTH=339 /DNA_ID=CAMNT_0043939421 /DNA_START=229 /DNA_END=1248 /DNA_ORIENTATION=+
MKSANKRKEKLIQLESLKAEVEGVRSERRRKLKWLVRRQKYSLSNKSKIGVEETPTKILNNSDSFTTDDDGGDFGGDNCDGDDRDDRDDRDDGDNIDDSNIGDADDGGSGIEDEIISDGEETLSSILYGAAIVEEDDKVQQNDLQHKSNLDKHLQQSEHLMTLEKRRLVARAKLVEEIRQAKEVKCHEMAKFAKEREEAKLAEEKHEGKGSGKIKSKKNSAEELVVGVQNSTLCKVLDCAEEELYDSDFSDSSFDPAIEVMDNSTADTDAVQVTVTDLIQAIEGFNTRLADIELMHSIILAEDAAVTGKDEFKTSTEGEQTIDTTDDFSLFFPNDMQEI